MKASRATYLDKILSFHRARAAADTREISQLAERVALLEPPRSFQFALSAGGLSIIAEIKRRSPSRGDLAIDLDPAGVAREYEAGGASCISVLTDSKHFAGSEADLTLARSAVGLPVLRKDFIVAKADIYDTRIMGADAVLLIVAALSDDELAEFGQIAGDLGLTALFEVHDEVELDRAVNAGARVIGVNQRDLVTFEVDRTRALDVAAAIPAGILSVAESGVRGPEDARTLESAGFDAVLVGESIVTSPDRAAAVRLLAN